MQKNRYTKTFTPDSPEQRFDGLWVPKELFGADLSLSEIVLVATIMSLEPCYASNAFLGSCVQMEASSVANTLSKLRKKGLVRDGGTEENRLLFVDKNAVQTLHQKMNPPSFTNEDHSLKNEPPFICRLTPLHQKMNPLSLKNEPFLYKDNIVDKERNTSSLDEGGDESPDDEGGEKMDSMYSMDEIELNGREVEKKTDHPKESSKKTEKEVPGDAQREEVLNQAARKDSQRSVERPEKFLAEKAFVEMLRDPEFSVLAGENGEESEFEQSYREFLESRRAMKKPVATANAVRIHLRDALKCGQAVAAQMLRQAVAAGTQGWYWPEKAEGIKRKKDLFFAGQRRNDVYCAETVGRRFL